MPQSGGSISTLCVGGEAVHGRYGTVTVGVVTVSLPEISSRDTLNVGKYRVVAHTVGLRGSERLFLALCASGPGSMRQ